MLAASGIVAAAGLQTDRLLGSWNFSGREGAIPFGHRMYGAPRVKTA